MSRMRPPVLVRSLVLGTLAVGVTLVVVACAAAAQPTPTSVGARTSSIPASSATASSVGGSSTPSSPPTAGSSGPDGGPSLTPVPGGVVVDPGPVQTGLPTMQVDWGTIVDGLPAEFPIFPGADIAEVPGEVVSGSFDAPADAQAVATWYRDILTDRGYAVELSQPLENGGLVLDAQADLPECRIQMSLRPEGESTIITVLLAAACAGGAGS